MSVRLKVLISAYACEPDKGSEPGVGWHFSRAMATHHDVWVLTRGNNRPAIEAAIAEQRVEGLHFAYYDLPALARWLKRGSRGVQAYYYAWQLGVLAPAIRLHQEIGFDLAHHLTFGKYWAPSRLIDLPVPLVWGPLGGGESAPSTFWSDFSPAGRRYEILRDAARQWGERDPLVRRTARKAALALASTPESAGRLTALGARNPRVFLQMGVPDAELAMRSDFQGGRSPVRFITIGRLIHWKGVHLGLRAFAAMEDKDCTYTIVGAGPEQLRLERLVASLGVTDRVRFLGSISREQTLSHLTRSDVLVHPSLHDQAPAVIFEALAAGVPVVCLALGGPALQVSDDTGIRVRAQGPEQSVRGLADAMDALARDPDRRASMGERGRQSVREHHVWSRKAEAMAAAYLTVVGVQEPLVSS